MAIDGKRNFFIAIVFLVIGGVVALSVGTGIGAGVGIATGLLGGCNEQVDDYIPASSIAGGGFLIDQQATFVAQDRGIKLWGFVDHGNLYGDADAKKILQEWWSGVGSSADTWRFNLKAEANDALGYSFPAHVPNDPGREDLLKRFVADARAGRPTKVFVRARLFTFDAPTPVTDLTGLYLELSSTRTSA